MTTTTTNQDTTTASTTDGSGWRSLIYVPAKVSDDDRHTIIEPASLQVLDQLLLPHTISYITIDTIQKGWDVIHHMNIRGAPLIAIVAILSLGIIDLQCHPSTQAELQQIESMNRGNGGGAFTSSSSSSTNNSSSTVSENMEDTFDAIQMYIHGKIDYLATSRPTAVNLFNALRDVKELIQSLRRHPSSDAPTTVTPKQRMVAAIVQYAEQMLQNDEADCRAIGDYGAQEIMAQLQRTTNNHNNNSHTNQITVMTICNTGSLATANYGTALGVIRSIHHNYGRLEQVVVLETRPYNQGSRLTAFECIQDALPNPILICDNMVTAFINNYHRNNNNSNNNNDDTKKNMVIVVGADRVVANGDTANKIGTYQLAVLASMHQIPFYVAAPTTTLDVQTKQGKEIHIEIRPSIELIQSSQAPKDMPVWNPAFDVTPAKYITGIITEKGVIHPKEDGTFDIAAFLVNGNELSEPKPMGLEEDITDYQEQTVVSLPSYIATNVPEAMKILNVTTADEIEAVEMGDGNLNLVFIVSNKRSNDSATDGTQAKIIVKQALPYVRCVGESWPLTLDRAFYEYTALQAQKKACSEHVPNLYYFSKKDALIVMEYLAPPIQILRKGLIAGIRYNTMAYDMGMFCAKTLFRTSGFALSTTELRQRVEFWSTNSMMCALTEQVVFTEPYIVASNNHWTTPFLDDDKKAIETNTELKLAASKWKLKFVTNTEALIHADLHTGSVMCAHETDHQTFVIDPEFAFYGPAAFDTGAFIANFLLSYVSQKAHRNNDDTNSDYDEWILQQIIVFWNTFVEQFTKYWNDSNEYTGFMYDCMKGTLNEDATIMKQCQDEYMQQFLCDSIGFAGMKMLRRIVGIAHVEDLQSITDVELRSECERRALHIAQYFIVHGCDNSSFKSIDDVVTFVRNTK